MTKEEILKAVLKVKSELKFTLAEIRLRIEGVVR